jgi:hypothetical protein
LLRAIGPARFAPLGAQSGGSIWLRAYARTRELAQGSSEC